MTLILRRDIVSARYHRNDIIAFHEIEFCVFVSTKRKLYGIEKRERKNRRDELS